MLAQANVTPDELYGSWCLTLNGQTPINMIYKFERTDEVAGADGRVDMRGSPNAPWTSQPFRVEDNTIVFPALNQSSIIETIDAKSMVTRFTASNGQVIQSHYERSRCEWE